MLDLQESALPKEPILLKSGDERLIKQRIAIFTVGS